MEGGEVEDGGDKLSLERLEMLRVIGTGTFARVCLCQVLQTVDCRLSIFYLNFAQDKSSKDYYALKILTMAQVIKLKQVEHVINEKEILR